MPTKILRSALSASTRKSAAAAAGSGTRLTAASGRRLGGVAGRAYSSESAAVTASVLAGAGGGGKGKTGRPWPDLDASKLQVTRTQRPQTPLPASELVFGRSFTDHMVTAEWSAEDGWLAPRISPYADFAMDPATCVLHYAFTAFEGSKAYKSRRDGSVRLFRPDRNWARLNRSVTRIALPGFDSDEMTKIIGRFISMDQHFVPDVRGYSLYLRPTVIGTQATLGVGPPGRAMFFCIASPVGPYYASGFRAVNLEATTDMVRAWPGGAGDAKLGANYAPCVVPQVQAASRGYNQNLWVFGPEEKVTEVGTMNLFVVMKKDDGSGRTEIITAPLDGMILAGITRESVLDLARERLVGKGFDVSERYTTMPELVRAADEGRLLEVFGTGTAAVVSPVRRIKYKDGEIDCGLAAHEEAGEIALQMKDWIEEIQYGDYEHPWSVKVC